MSTGTRASSDSVVEALRSSGLLTKLQRLNAGRVVRCSRQACAQLMELTGLPLMLARHESGGWKGYILRPEGPGAAKAVAAWLEQHGYRASVKRAPKSGLERQLDWQQRAQESGMRKLVVYLAPQAAQDLETIVQSLGGRAQRGTQRAAVEMAISEKAARLRRRNMR